VLWEYDAIMNISEIVVRFGAFAFLFAVSSAFAATTTSWLGGNGNWSDSTKWDKGVPSGSDFSANINTGSEGCTINLDMDVTINKIYVYGTSQANRFRLTGSHKLNMTQADVASGGAIVVDGPVIVTANAALSSGYVEIRSGSWTHEGSVFYSTAKTSALVVSGGDFYTKSRFKMSESADASLTVSAGSFSCPGSFEVMTKTETFSGKTPSTTTRWVNPIKVTGGLFNISGSTLPLPGPSHDFGSATNVIAKMQFYGTGSKDTAPRYYSTSPVVLKTEIDPYDWGSNVAFPHGVAFGAVGDWNYSRRIALNIRDFISFDTSDFFDATKSHDVRWQYLDSARAHVDWSFAGGGSVRFVLGDNMVPLGGMGKLGAWTIGDGTTVSMDDETKSTADIRPAYLHVTDLALGANAKLYLSPCFSYVQPSETASFGAGSTVYAHGRADVDYATKLNYTCNGSSVLVVGAGPLGDAKAISAEAIGTFPSPWHLTNVVNCVLLHNGVAPTPDATKARQWVGGADNRLSTAGNWASGKTPDLTGNKVSVNLNTLCGEIVNDVDGCRVERFNATQACGPVRIGGKPIELTGNGCNRSSVSAIDLYYFYYPLVFNCDVTGTGADWFSTAAGNYAPACYVAYMKKLDASKPKHFQVYGHVIVGGEARANDLTITAQCGNALRSMLEIVNGGNMVVSSQSTALSYADGGIRVNRGGRLAFASGVLSYSANMVNCVHGDLEIAALSATSPFSLIGSGNVYLKETRSSAKASAVSIGDRLRLYLQGNWNTLSSHGTGPLTLKLDSWATLGAMNDWTYGVAAGVSTKTDAAARALVVADYETLFLDTQSPNNGAAHTVTLADPVSAPNGFVVKQGKGTLVLASAANRLSTAGVRVEQGELLLLASQSFGTLEVADGASLTVDTGCVAEVAGDVSVDGAVIGLTTAAKSAVGSGWTPVVKVAAGGKVTGKPGSMPGGRSRVRVDADGSTLIEFRRSMGLMKIVR